MKLKPFYFDILLSLILAVIVVYSYFSSDEFLGRYLDRIILGVNVVLFSAIIAIRYQVSSAVKKLDDMAIQEQVFDEKFSQIAGDILATIKVYVKEFKSEKEQNNYYQAKLRLADRVEDLTWATIDRDTRSKGGIPAYMDDIKTAIERGTDFDEVFIFNHNENYRYDRLRKLKFHYENAKSGNKSRYSCAYYKTASFPRIQYTIIDEDEIMFTSSRNTRCIIKSEMLVQIFSKYYTEAWENATLLIDNGEIVDEKLIRQILGNLVE